MSAEPCLAFLIIFAFTYLFIYILVAVFFILKQHIFVRKRQHEL